MKKTIFLLNGPPECGKDSICVPVFKEYFSDIDVYRFKDPVVNIAVNISGLEPLYFEDRDLKDTPNLTLNGDTPRKFLQLVAEKWVKPYFGKDYFANVIKQNILSSPKNLFLITDLGFISEIDVFNNPTLSLHVFQIKRKGYTFKKLDTRNYIYCNLNNVKTYKILNNSSIDKFSFNLKKTLNSISHQIAV